MVAFQFLLLGCAIGLVEDQPSPTAVSRQILDESLPAEERRQLAARQADRADAVVAALVADLPADDLPEEYRRIPWIWRVSVVAGRKNEADVLRALLKVSLPEEGEKLRDWQAVVIGGGIINGISLSGAWPRPRIEELLGNDEALRLRWQRALVSAAAMAGDTKVKTGTRYDALRMIALGPQEPQLKQLAGYLAKETNPELQMGAVSGLGDVDDPQAARLLSAALPELAPDNRILAIDALLRNDARTEVLLGLLESGKLAPATLNEAQRKKLRDLPDGRIRDRALRVLDSPKNP
jgi:hypothetical protein